MSAKHVDVTEAELRRLRKIQEHNEALAVTDGVMRNGQQPAEFREKVLVIPDGEYVHPLWPNLLCEMLDSQEVNESTKAPDSKIILPTNQPCRSREGIIIELPVCLDKNFQPMEWPFPYKVGERMVLQPFVGAPVHEQGKVLEFIPIAPLQGALLGYRNKTPRTSDTALYKTPEVVPEQTSE